MEISHIYRLISSYFTLPNFVIYMYFAQRKGQISDINTCTICNKHTIFNIHTKCIDTSQKSSKTLIGHLPKQGYTNSRTDRQMDRQANGQTGRQTMGK